MSDQAHLILVSSMSGHFPLSPEEADNTIERWTAEQVAVFVIAHESVLIAERSADVMRGEM